MSCQAGLSTCGVARLPQGINQAEKIPRKVLARVQTEAVGEGHRNHPGVSSCCLFEFRTPVGLRPTRTGFERDTSVGTFFISNPLEPSRVALLTDRPEPAPEEDRGRRPPPGPGPAAVHAGQGVWAPVRLLRLQAEGQQQVGAAADSILGTKSRTVYKGAEPG